MFFGKEKRSFLKSELMHDIFIGLSINAVEFGIDIHAKMQI